MGRLPCWKRRLKKKELLSTLFNVDGAGKGIKKGWFSGIKDTPSCELDGISVRCERGGRRKNNISDGSVVGQRDS